MTPYEANADLLAEITALRERVASLTRENAELQGALAQGRHREAATSEILRVISNSPADLTPVLESLARNAARLCEADDVSIIRAESDGITILFSLGPAAAFRGQRFPTIRSATSRAINEGRTIHVPDLLADPYYETRPEFQGFAWRTGLAVPLLRDGAAIGTITARRSEVRPFSDEQIKLLETFADQAVIAIENVRLFKELETRNSELTEALEQQTATSEILRVISESQTDLQPVFEAIVRSAAQLCEATFSVLHQVDGQAITFEAQHGMTEQEAEGSRHRFPLPTDRETAVGRAILDRRTTHLHDIRLDPEYRVRAGQTSFRTVLAVPLLREGVPVGAIGLWRREVQPFSEKQIKLVETCADQAVIAIENVRLFKELETRNRDLTEALEQQTATSEILQVISSSPTDVQPVFDSLLASAVRLCGATHASLYKVEADLLRHVAAQGALQGPVALGVSAPIPRGTAPGQAVLTGEPVHMLDSQREVDHMPLDAREFVIREGVRTVLAVPLLREGTSIGVIVIRRTEVRPFADSEIRLLQTFADQAVIAIENVRLFKELETRNRDLTESLEQQTATSEILRVISSSPTDVQPVFDTIAESSLRLCAALFSSVYRFDGELIHMVAHQNYPSVALEASRQLFHASQSATLHGPGNP